MKQINSFRFIIPVLLFTAFSVFAQDTLDSCALGGTPGSPEETVLNPKKNRWHAPVSSDYDNTVTLEKMIKPGVDYGRFDDTKAGEITGYVTYMSWGWAESCNCGREGDKLMQDIHIEISKSKSNKNHFKSVIVEVTPRMRETLFGLFGLAKTESNTKLKNKIFKQKVKIQGWLLFDYEHEDQARNTDKYDHIGRHNTRRTCWEIHPINNIECLDCQ